MTSGPARPRPIVLVVLDAEPAPVEREQLLHRRRERLAVGELQLADERGRDRLGLGEHAGLRTSLAVAGGGALLLAAVTWQLGFLRRVRELPAPERVDEWRRGEVLFPSVRVDATTVNDLFGAERDGQNPAPGAKGNVDHFCLVIEPTDLDALAARFGEESLRYSAMATTSLYVIAAVLMGLAALRLARDSEPTPS